MNEQISETGALVSNSLKAFLEVVVQALPGLLMTFVILLLGWIVARIISYVVKKVLGVMQFDSLADKINLSDMLQKANLSITPTAIVGKFVYYIILLLFFVMAADSLGLTMVSEQISELIALLPKLLVGLIIFVIGYYIATFVRDVIWAAMSSLGVGAGKIVGSFVFYFMLIIVTITALDQIGINTYIITRNVEYILGAILFTGSISYAFASRDILSNMLASFFSQKTFAVGQTIRLDDIEGEIIKLDNICITLRSGREKIVIPTHDLITNRIRIIRDPEEEKQALMDDLG